MTVVKRRLEQSCDHWIFANACFRATKAIGIGIYRNGEEGSFVLWGLGIFFFRCG